jgi:hypothetical protein
MAVGVRAEGQNQGMLDRQECVEMDGEHRSDIGTVLNGVWKMQLL